MQPGCLGSSLPLWVLAPGDVPNVPPALYFTLYPSTFLMKPDGKKNMEKVGDFGLGLNS